MELVVTLDKEQLYFICFFLIAVGVSILILVSRIFVLEERIKKMSEPKPPDVWINHGNGLWRNPSYGMWEIRNDKKENE